MRIKTLVISFALALVMAMGAAAFVPATQTGFRAQASPMRVTVAQKVILPETSVSSPGFFANANLGDNGVIAWAGTDSAHHINVMTSTDGLHYGHKITLSLSTVNRPAVTQMSSEAGKVVIIAWRGVDSAHHLNVLFDVYGSQKRLTLPETSFVGPSLAIFNGDLLLAWVGNDPHHSLNVMPISLSSLTPKTKTTLWQFTAYGGPSLTTVNQQAQSVVLGWSTAASTQLNLASSTDGVHFTTALGAGLPETSYGSPDMLWYMTEGGPEYWLAWTGTDNSRHLNAQWTTSYPQWPNPAHTKTILPDLAYGPPTLGFEEGVLIAWTGTDAAHHLNVARLQGF